MWPVRLRFLLLIWVGVISWCSCLAVDSLQWLINVCSLPMMLVAMFHVSDLYHWMDLTLEPNVFCLVWSDRLLVFQILFSVLTADVLAVPIRGFDISIHSSILYSDCSATWNRFPLPSRVIGVLFLSFTVMTLAACRLILLFARRLWWECVPAVTHHQQNRGPGTAWSGWLCDGSAVESWPVMARGLWWVSVNTTRQPASTGKTSIAWSVDPHRTRKSHADLLAGQTKQLAANCQSECIGRLMVICTAGYKNRPTSSLNSWLVGVGHNFVGMPAGSAWQFQYTYAIQNIYIHDVSDEATAKYTVLTISVLNHSSMSDTICFVYV